MTKNILFSSQQIAIMFGFTERTFYNKLVWLKKKKKFKKKTHGYCYGKTDVKKMAKLLGLDIKL